MNSDDELGRLLSLISHEIRAPLGVMRGYLRLIEQQGADLSEPHRHAVAAALKAGERATELLAQVSTLARLCRGEAAPATRAIPLEPVLREAMHRVVLPREPIITLHVEDTPAVSVVADDELLRGAIAGLTSAVVRAQALDARVFVHARLSDRSRRPGVQITIGTTESEYGTRGDGPLDLSRGGLGLELPLAACIVTAHQGEVQERHERGRFAGVVVWLPLASHD